MDAILQTLALLSEPKVVGIVLVSAVYGLFIGAMPGLTATMATALLVPFTFFLDPLSGLVAIITMEAMAIFAGDIPAVLLRIPGTPSSAAYTEDSYELTKQGKGEIALGLDLICSAAGGIMGAVAFIIGAPLLVLIAMNFTSFENFWLAVLGLSGAAMVSSGAPLKGTISALFGLFLSTIGIDITLGYPRFTFGNVNLLNGISFIPAMIGLYGVSEVLRAAMSPHLEYPITRVRAENIFQGIYQLLRRYKVQLFRGGLIGTFVGALPGAGADIAAWLSYAVARRFSREPEKFGKGSFEPIIDAGTANNAALGAAWIPALVFGIPGDPVTAIVIGVLMMKGLRPGPLIFQEQAGLLNGLRMMFILANLLMLPLGYLAIRLGSSIIRIPRNTLMPIILAFSIVGAYALENSLFDVGIMLVMGIVGYLMESNGFPIAPVVLGLVLGPLIEQNFMISMIKAQWNLLAFFSRPASLVLGVVTLVVWMLPVLMFVVRRKPLAEAASEG